MELVRSVPNKKMILVFLKATFRIGWITLNGTNLSNVNNKIINKFIHWLKLKISKYNKITFHIEGNPMYENDVSTKFVFA